MDNRTGSYLLHHVSLTLDRIWIWGIWIDSFCSLSRPTGSVLGQCGVGMILEVHEDAAVGSSSKLNDFFFFSPTMTLLALMLKHVLLMSAVDLEAITAHWVQSSPGTWPLDRPREEDSRNKICADPACLRLLLAHVCSQETEMDKMALRLDWQGEIRDLSQLKTGWRQVSAVSLDGRMFWADGAQDYSWTRGAGLCVYNIDAWCSHTVKVPS